MKKFLYKTLPIVLSILGIAVPVYLEYFKERYSLTLYMKSQHEIIKNDSNISELSLSYKTTQIKELYSTRFLFLNSGNKYFDKTDVIKPIKIIFNNADILDIRPHKTQPEDANITTIKTGHNEISIDFDLMNPTDNVEFDILTTTPITSFKASARIKRLLELKSLHFVENPPLKGRVTNYQIYSVPVSIILFILFYMGWRKIAMPIRSTAYYIKNELQPDEFEKEFFIKFLKKSTENMLDEDTLVKIKSRLENTDIKDNKSLNKFREETFFDLLNRDVSGIMSIAMLAMLSWITFNIWSLVSSMIYV